MKLYKDSLAYNPFPWALESESYMKDEEFIDLFIGARVSQMKV